MCNIEWSHPLNWPQCSAIIHAVLKSVLSHAFDQTNKCCLIFVEHELSIITFLLTVRHIVFVQPVMRNIALVPVLLKLFLNEIRVKSYQAPWNVIVFSFHSGVESKSLSLQDALLVFWKSAAVSNPPSGIVLLLPASLSLTGGSVGTSFEPSSLSTISVRPSFSTFFPLLTDRSKFFFLLCLSCLVDWYFFIAVVDCLGLDCRLCCSAGFDLLRRTYQNAEFVCE